MKLSTKEVSEKTGIGTNALCRYAQRIGVKRAKAPGCPFQWSLSDIHKATAMYKRPEHVRLLSDSDLYDTLEQVARCGSYAEAGRQMYLHHVAVRYRIMRLQEMHNKPIVKTSCFGVELTNYGRCVLTEERPLWGDG